MKTRLAVLAVLVLVACDSASSDPTGPTTSTSSTTTTIENDTCERVVADTVRFLEAVIETLDTTRLREFSSPEEWPDELRDLQRAGKDLDLRVAALRCDPAELQQRVFSEADLDPEGPLSEELLRLLLNPDPLPEPAPSTTSTTAATTTTGGG